MKTECSTTSTSAGTFEDEAAIVTSQRAAADIATSTAGPVALCTPPSLLKGSENNANKHDEKWLENESIASSCIQEGAQGYQSFQENTKNTPILDILGVFTQCRRYRNNKMAEERKHI